MVIYFGLPSSTQRQWRRRQRRSHKIMYINIGTNLYFALHLFATNQFIPAHSSKYRKPSPLTVRVCCASMYIELKGKCMNANLFHFGLLWFLRLCVLLFFLPVRSVSSLPVRWFCFEWPRVSSSNINGLISSFHITRIYCM